VPVPSRPYQGRRTKPAQPRTIQPRVARDMCALA
jgi:hypothetical protein